MLCLSTTGTGLHAVAADNVVGAVVCKASHWSAVRVVDNDLWLLDSLKQAPTKVVARSATQSAVAAVKATKATHCLLYRQRS